MKTSSFLSFAVSLVVGACATTAVDPDSESHFMCRSDADCTATQPSGATCVSGECVAPRNAADSGTPDAREAQPDASSRTPEASAPGTGGSGTGGSGNTGGSGEPPDAALSCAPLPACDGSGCASLDWNEWLTSVECAGIGSGFAVYVYAGCGRIEIDQEAPQGRFDRTYYDANTGARLGRYWTDVNTFSVRCEGTVPAHCAAAPLCSPCGPSAPPDKSVLTCVAGDQQWPWDPLADGGPREPTPPGSDAGKP